MSDIRNMVEAYLEMVSEMRGATSGRRQSRTFPLNKKSEADAFAKKHGGKVEKKGATLYVTWDLPEALDPVNDKENSKKFKDRKDKDIDNDGDVDSSDKYLHKRRKAVSKAVKGQEEKDTIEEKGKCMRKESVAHSQWGFGEVIEETEDGLNIYFEHGVEFGVSPEDVLVVGEGKTHAERNKGATAPEEIDSKLAKGPKRFKDMHTKNVDVDDTLEKAKKDSVKAAKALPNQSPTRGGEKRIGDKNPINQQKDITKG
jgi:hypothetical protein